jgi:hypothetical protein
LINKKIAHEKKYLSLDSFLSMVVVYLLLFYFLAAPQKKTTESDVTEVKMEHSENSENSKILKRIKLDITTKVDDKTKPLQLRNCNSIDPTKPASITDGQEKIDLNNASLTEETTTKTGSEKTSSFSSIPSSGWKRRNKENSLQKNTVVNEDLDKSGFDFWSWLWMAGAHYRCDRLSLLKQALYPN